MAKVTAMARNAMMDDLFGHVPQERDAGSTMATPARADRDADRERDMLYPEVPPGGHTADTIRPIALGILAEAQALNVLDWSPRKLRSHTAMFPYMAEWLSGGEGDRLLQAFKAEMDRLGAPADQVAPNWRRIWGIAA